MNRFVFVRHILPKIAQQEIEKLNSSIQAWLVLCTSFYYTSQILCIFCLFVCLFFYRVKVCSNPASKKKKKRKIFWKRFTIPEAIKNLHDSWEKVKTWTLAGLWKKLIPTLSEDFEMLKTSVEEVTADVVKIGRELQLEAEPQVAELLQSPW